MVDINGYTVAHLFTQENRIPVPLGSIPESLQRSIVVVEDIRFWHHFGIDPLGIVRAAIRNLLAGEVVEGGSTITQQLAKNLYLAPERTATRKIREAIIALQLEYRFSKEEILEQYLNVIFFGAGAYGVEAAARTYFDKGVQDLNWAESTLLAGLPQAPSRYSPFTNLEAARKRQTVVLNRLVQAGVLSRMEADGILATPLDLAEDRTQTREGGYFLAEVRRQVALQVENGEERLQRGGLTVATTLDLSWQRVAEKIFQEHLADYPGLQGALVAIDPFNGEVRAMVGGTGFETTQFNRAISRPGRQPGSAMKPILYAAALEKGWKSSDVFTCEPVSFSIPGAPDYYPTDYGEPYHYRNLTLKEAVQISDNVVAVQLINQIGPASVSALGKKLGIQSDLRPYLSLALGTSEVTPMDLATAYGAFPALGIKYRPLMVKEVSDAKGRVVWRQEPRGKLVLDERTAYIMTDILQSVLQPGGTASHLAGRLNRPAAGKTGTTQDLRDAWFVGYTPKAVIAVFVGYDDYSRPVGIPGGRIAGPIWADFVQTVFAEVPPEDFPIPPGIKRLQVCRISGALLNPTCPPIEVVLLEEHVVDWCPITH